MCETDEQRIELIKKYVGVYNDFKPGISFKDIFTALREPEVCLAIKDLLCNHIKKNFPDVEVIVGLDARGFLFSLLIAAELKLACVPVRKKGKLPGECFRVEYALEYGTDTFEIQCGSIKKGQKVLIVDDLLATGGSLGAASKLVKKTDGELLGGLVIMELSALNGRKQFDMPVHSFIKYDD